MASVIVSRTNLFGRFPMADDVTDDEAGDVIDGLAVVARHEEMFAGDKVGDEPGELLGDIDGASLAGLPSFLDWSRTGPGTGGHREVHIVWESDGTKVLKDEVTAMPDGFTLGGMSMVITFPDEAADRLRAAAVTRGVSVDEIALGLVVEHLPAVDHTVRARAALEAFIGSVSGDGSRFEIHDARRDLAARRRAQGTRNL